MNLQLALLLCAIMAFVAGIGCIRLGGLLDDMRKRKDAAYQERNEVVALLATVYPSGIARTAIDGWDREWHNCVYIDLPFSGQVSWHYHDDHRYLFTGLPPYRLQWDGHDTPTKYHRVSDQRIRNVFTNDARAQQ